MAVPAQQRFGTGSSKTTGTTVAIFGSTANPVVGDYVLVTFGMDQAAGAVTAAITGGTAVIGAWTVDQDVSNGSGTSGTRFVATYAKCTSAGTITQITVTHPSVAARAGEFSLVTGADGTTPILFSAVATVAAASLGPVPAGLDLLIIGSCVQQAASAGAVNASGVGITAGWTVRTADVATSGTTGGGASSNISTAIRGADRSPSISQTVVNSVVSSSDQWYDSIWQAPQALTPSLIYSTRPRSNSIRLR